MGTVSNPLVDLGAIPVSQNANPLSDLGAVPVGQQQTQPEQKKGFVEGLYENTLGPIVSLGKELGDYYQNKSAATKAIDTAGGPLHILVDAVSDPNHPLRKLGAGFVEAALDQAKKAIADGKDATQAGSEALQGLIRGDFSSAATLGKEAQLSAVETAGHATATLLPGIGPAAAEAGEHIATGETGFGLGEATGLITSVTGPRLAGKATSKVAGAIGKGEEAAAVNRVVAATAPKGAQASVEFIDSVKRALPEMRSVAQGVSAPRDLAGMLRLTEEATARLERDFRAALDPVKDVQVSTNAIADAIKSKITRYLEKTNPDLVEQIKKRASIYRDQTLTLGELDDFRRSVNDELNAFYAKNNLRRADALKDPNTAHAVAEADAIRDLEYESLSRATGQDLRAMKKMQSDLIEVRDAAKANLNRLVIKDAGLRARSMTKGFWNAAEHFVSSHPLAGIRQFASLIFKGSPELRSANKAVKRAFRPSDLYRILRRGEQLEPTAEIGGKASAVMSGQNEEE